ncbi:MAG: response regulator transcription factor [Chloroflexota bacterium]
MKILVVDDDRVLADVVTFTLRREGYEVIQAYDGDVALQRWEEDEPALILLDINLPKVDGFTVCRLVREQSDTPIILLTVRGEEDDIVQGLEMGADDYIVKPFSPRQLVARTKAVLRRTGQKSSPQTLQLGDLQFDYRQRVVNTPSAGQIALTPLENRLLHTLMLNTGHVVSYDSIIDRVWGPTGGDRDMVRQVVHRLRNKIEEDPANPIYIQTIPGLGYGIDHK